MIWRRRHALRVLLSVMRATFVCLVLLLPSTAAASPGLVVYGPTDGPVSADEIARILRAHFPVVLVGPPLEPLEPAARVELAVWSDGRIAVLYQEASGRETLRLVEAGSTPAATVAMVVENLHRDQLDLLLGAPAATRVSPVPSRPPPAPGVGARREVPLERQEALLDGSIGLALVRRSFAVAEPLGFDRSLSSSGYPVASVDVRVYPGALLRARGALRHVGMGLHFARSLLLEVSGGGVLGEAVSVDSSHQELGVWVQARVPLADHPDAPAVQGTIGWGSLELALDPIDVSMILHDGQMPTMVYAGPTASLGGDLPLLASWLRLDGHLALHWALDVGQHARDLLGSDTQSAWGWAAGLGLTAEVVEHLEGTLALDYRSMTTEFSGRALEDDGHVREFGAGTDAFLALSVAARATLD